MPESMATVYVVDDDAPHLASVERLLRALGYTVSCHQSAQGFLAHLPPEAAGCVVADLQMPTMDGMALQRALAESTNPLPIVFLTGHGDIPTSVAAMRSGAEDFLKKTAPKEQLVAAIERAIHRDSIQRLERERTREIQSRLDRLTSRERQVLSYVIRGSLNKNIAMELGITERSVKRHRTSMMRKLEVRSVPELTRLALVAHIQPEAPETDGASASLRQKEAR